MYNDLSYSYFAHKIANSPRDCFKQKHITPRVTEATRVTLMTQRVTMVTSVTRPPRVTKVISVTIPPRFTMAVSLPVASAVGEEYLRQEV